MLSHDQEMQARETAEKAIRLAVASYVRQQHISSTKVLVHDLLVEHLAVAVVDALLQPQAEVKLRGARSKAVRLDALRREMQQRAIDMHKVSLEMSEGDWIKYELDADEYSPFALGEDVARLLEEGSF